MAAVPYRLYLGTQPSLAVEERLLRQLQPVFSWYTSRRRVKEQAHDFVELDLASCDPELMLRYCHVYYVRRQIFDELVDKQLTMIETGKLAKPADPALMACLSDCSTMISRRLQYELHTLQEAKKACTVPHRRELDPAALLEPFDYLCMMRVVEEDACQVADAEMQSRAFLPRDLIETKAQELSSLFFGAEGAAAGSTAKKATASASQLLDKKDAKLLQRLIPADYSKVGCVEKLRPVDVSTYYRFVGERASRLPATPENHFKRCLFAHVFRKFASHPVYLSSISMYWARYSGMDPKSVLTTMPKELTEAVCAQQQLFPALKFRSQYMYASPDMARQRWRSDSVIPLMRLFPALGAAAAEDLAAAMVVESEWARLQLEPGKSPQQESVVRSVKTFVEQIGGMYENSRDAVWKRVEEGVKAVCPPLSEGEARSMLHREEEEAAAPPTSEPSSKASAASATA